MFIKLASKKRYRLGKIILDTSMWFRKSSTSSKSTNWLAYQEFKNQRNEFQNVYGRVNRHFRNKKINVVLAIIFSYRIWDLMLEDQKMAKKSTKHRRNNIKRCPNSIKRLLMGKHQFSMKSTNHIDTASSWAPTFKNKAEFPVRNATNLKTCARKSYGE